MYGRCFWWNFFIFPSLLCNSANSVGPEIALSPSLCSTCLSSLRFPLTSVYLSCMPECYGHLVPECGLLSEHLFGHGIHEPFLFFMSMPLLLQNCLYFLLSTGLQCNCLWKQKMTQSQRKTEMLILKTFTVLSHTIQ